MRMGRSKRRLVPEKDGSSRHLRGPWSLALLQVMPEVGTATSNLAPPLRGAFLLSPSAQRERCPACLSAHPTQAPLSSRGPRPVPAREARCWRRTADRRAEAICLPVEERPRFEISKMQSRHRLVEQLGQRSQRHNHKCRSSNDVERCCSSRTLTCSGAIIKLLH